MDSLLVPRQALLASVEASLQESSKLLFGFNSEVEKLPWRIVLDGVMGGLSTGNIEVDSGVMSFTGQTSLQNNGGFSSIRAPLEMGSIQPGEVRGLEFYIYDKKAGPFTLEIDSIEAVQKRY